MKSLSLSEVKDYLLNNYSKSSCDLVAKAAHDQPKVCRILVDLITGKDALLAQKAAWSLGLMADMNANLLQPYCGDLIAVLKKPNHDAVARNIVRLWQKMDLPVQFHGEIYELCYQFLANPHTAIAVRAFSATVCGRICVMYPELKPEIIEMLPLWKENAPPAVIVRIRQLEKQLH